MVGHGTVVVTGNRTMGLLCAALSCAKSAREVVLVDVNKDRRTFESKWPGAGCDAARAASAEIRIFESRIDVDAVVNVRLLKLECELKDGADIVFEALGVSSAAAIGVYVLRMGNARVRIGLSKKPLMSGFHRGIERERDSSPLCIQVQWRRFRSCDRLIGREMAGPVKELISEVHNFERYEDAWKATRDGHARRERYKESYQSLKNQAYGSAGATDERGRSGSS